uniref:NYN domain-containing protein n=1 Tax=Noccaea caerulescens TaxID=107243 RepID=A0A1J3CEA9_NOCCA
MSSVGGGIGKRRNRRSKSPVDPLPPVPSISRGELTLTEKQQNALNTRKERRKITRRTIYAVLMDVDNITEQLRVNPGFDVNTLQRRVKAFLKTADPDSEIYNRKLIGVGNMKKFFGFGKSRFTLWKGVYVHDIFARKLQCKNCQRIFLQAENSNRRTVKYESLTDVSDAKLEHLILSHARKFPDHKIVIVGGDRDFVRCITILRVCGGEVYLALSDSCGKDFENAVDEDHRVEFRVIVNTPPAPEDTN